MRQFCSCSILFRTKIVFESVKAGIILQAEFAESFTCGFQAFAENEAKNYWSPIAHCFRALFPEAHEVLIIHETANQVIKTESFENKHHAGRSIA